MAVKSGIPAVVNGVQVGATDFSEFTIGAGTPVGITGLSANFPSGQVGISDTPVSPSFTDEGKYFFIDNPITTNAPWAFVIDAFDGIMEQGELLARISTNYGGLQNFRCMGPGMSLRLNPGIFGSASSILDAFSSGDVEVAGGVFINGGIANSDFFSISQPLQEDDWIWMRIRKTPNVADPNDDDWQVTAWYGDIEDEPATPDGIQLAATLTAPRGLFGIGCTYLTSGSRFTQRCAFLSYSENPDVEPPPVPPLGAATIWTPFPEVFEIGLPKPTIINAEVEYDARALVLSDGDPVVTWPDTSGSGNDAVDAPAPSEQPTYRADRWAPGSLIPSVEFLNFGVGPPSREESMNYDAQAAYRGSELTIFIVAQVKDLSEGAAFIGTLTGATPPREIDVCAFADGTLLFGFGTESPTTESNIITAPGVIVEDELLLITCRSTGGSAGVDPEGMLIRLNGEQVASVPGFVIAPSNVVGAGGVQQGSLGRSQNTGSPELGLPGGTIWGVDRLITWIGGYSVAASNEQIVQMESFLAGAFGFDFRTPWTDQPEVSPGTVWANIP